MTYTTNDPRMGHDAFTNALATACVCGNYDRHDYDHGVSRCEPQTTTTTTCPNCGHTMSRDEFTTSHRWNCTTTTITEDREP